MKANKKQKGKDAKSEKPASKKDLKQKMLGFLKNNYIYIIMVGLVILRILLGYGLGGWYGMSETYDDVAMMQGLSFKRLAFPTNLALIKDLSFSLFLGFSAITRLPYTVVLAGVWVLTAFVAWLLTRKMTKNKWIQFLVFSYVLFLPIAFTSWGGLRIYRNAIIAPCIILTFSLALMMIVNLARGEKIKRTFWSALFTGIMFAFTYFLKEDGLWLKLCMIVVLFVSLAIVAYKFLSNKVKTKDTIKKAVISLMICMLPMGVLYVWDTTYRSFNYAVFGVYEINTRTEGELGRFVENIYKIDSENRNEVVWAPYDAIEKAFEVSPTLSSHPELLEQIMTTGWNEGGIKDNPIKYDFLGWVMRSELLDAGLWTSEAEVNEMFRQVNNELREAFENGTLKKAEGRIQLLASTGGYTWDEIVNSNIVNQVFLSLGDSIWLVNYDVGFSNDDVAYGTKGLEWDYTKVNKVLHMVGDVNVVDGRDVAETVGTMIVWMYRIIDTVMVAAGFFFVNYVFIGLIKKWKNKKDYLEKNKLIVSLAVTSIMFFAVTVAYSFATAWFFVSPDASSTPYAFLFVYYRVGVPALFTLSLLPTVIGVIYVRENNR